ncbi:triosephosphate isomerase [candidate division WWE3 bacterium]|jgi:triosephosphate isomerase|nr:triosephosphate isomerase [candidate division WWE3 bacterium]MBT7350352.1 triosephosphate isomerase [candidate division WWE3 bacterium]
MKKYVIANWKQNMNLTEVHSWIAEFTDTVIGTIPSVEVVLCPPMPYLSIFADLVQGYDWLHVGAQDLSATDMGAHTGDVDVSQILDFAEFSIVGHSERKEDRALVNEKITRCLEGGLQPIACFVEKKDSVTAHKDGVVVAWEDPQNISKEGVYSPKDPAEIEAGLDDVAALLPSDAIILYGGSVNRDNIAGIVGFENLSGVILGGASLDAKHLFDIITAFN